MINYRLVTVTMLACFVAAPLFAADPLAFSVDETTRSYTITEQGRPVLTYRFGEVPLPAGSRRIISARPPRRTAEPTSPTEVALGASGATTSIRSTGSTASR